MLIREYFNPNVVLEAFGRGERDRRGHVGCDGSRRSGGCPVKLEPEFGYTQSWPNLRSSGPGPTGCARVLAVTGGKVTGNRFSGTAAPAAGGLAAGRRDGYGRLDVRARSTPTTARHLHELPGPGRGQRSRRRRTRRR